MQSISNNTGRALILNREVQRDLVSREKINEVIGVCMSSKLGDSIASELLDGVIKPIFNAFENEYQRIMFDYDLRVTLARNGDYKKDGSFYSLHITIEYKFVLKIPELKFACVSSLSDFREYLINPRITHTYLLPHESLPEKAFDIPTIDIQCRGKSIILERLDEEPSKGIKVISFRGEGLSDFIGLECKLFYKVSSVIDSNGHFYFYRTKHPIKNLKITFDSGNTDITQVDVVDQFVSSGPVILHEERTYGKIIKMVSVDGWIFPNSGITFVWGSSPR